jgi:SAM-dependent methyltransferase
MIRNFPCANSCEELEMVTSSALLRPASAVRTMVNTPAQSALDELAKKEGFYWGDDVSDSYFAVAERDMDLHWTSIIHPVIKDCCYSTVVDLAAGHGRNAYRLIENATHVTCVDINPENIAFLKRRFKNDRRFTVIQNNGVGLPQIPDNSVDLAYSFDSMVHFDLEIVIAYVKEFYRIVRPGGVAFVHHSNYAVAPGADFRMNPHWRNFMSIQLFEHIARRSGFVCVTSRPIAWGGIDDLDGIALLRKPG